MHFSFSAVNENADENKTFSIFFHYCFIFSFRSKNAICVGPKMLCSQLNRD